MSGRPGRSGGHNKLSAAEHIARGTFNRTRHQVRATLAERPTLLPLRRVPAWLLNGLDGEGRAFVEDTWRTYGGWIPSNIVLLREAGRLLTDLDTQRGKPAERVTQRVLLSVLAALDLRAATPAPAPAPNWPGIPQRIK